MINFRVTGYVLGMLLLIEGLFMLLAAIVSYFFREHDAPFIVASSFITLLAGFFLWLAYRRSNMDIGKREGYIIVSSGWVVLSLFGALPFIISGAIPSYTDAFFETMSGFTTTGASILTDVEVLSYGLHFWRSIIQWLGGMGIIVLSLVIIPALGIGGMQLFIAEVPGVTYDKLHPRIKETAKRLWAIYLILTVAQTVLLKVAGMGLFDAVCHSFTTMATGGFSTKNASIGYYPSPYIHYIVILFMILAGANFTLSYLAMHFRFRSVFRNEEFRYYLSFIAIYTAVITLVLLFSINQPWEKSFRESLFQVVSIITTTGFATADYLLWPPIGAVLLFTLMFFGGMAGSTGGGMKIIRITLLLKNSILELKRLIHPNAIIPVRINEQSISPQIVTNVLAFASFYVMIIVLSVIVISFMGYDLNTSFGAAAATLGNIGPGIGDVGPVSNYGHFPAAGKWFLSFLMLIGRLELFTVLILFSPYFWKK